MAESVRGVACLKIYRTKAIWIIPDWPLIAGVLVRKKKNWNLWQLRHLSQRHIKHETFAESANFPDSP